MNKRKVLFLGNSKLTVFGFRGEIIEELIKQGYDVVTVFPNGPFGEGEEEAKKYGCKFIELSMNRRGKNPFQDLILLKKYLKILKKEKPDYVLAFTVKCDVYGGIVCRILNIPFIPNITGLGKGLAEGGVTEMITRCLYKFAVKKSRCIFFQNEGDKKYFDDNRIKYNRGIVLPGSGVNLEKFKPLEYPKENENVKFIYVARIMKTKGIDQYLEVAHEIKKEYPNVEFHVCGFCEEDYKDIILDRERKNEIIYHGLVDDVKEFEKDCHCVVLPSYHPEGVSNVLLEAAACARPIITTNRNGCRETVNDGVTGYIIEPQKSESLYNVVKIFLNLSHDSKKKMGIEGRKKIESQFDRKIVVDYYLNEILKK